MNYNEVRSASGSGQTVDASRQQQVASSQPNIQPTTKENVQNKANEIKMQKMSMQEQALSQRAESQNQIYSNPGFQQLSQHTTITGNEEFGQFNDREVEYANGILTDFLMRGVKSVGNVAKEMFSYVFNDDPLNYDTKREIDELGKLYLKETDPQNLAMLESQIAGLANKIDFSMRNKVIASASKYGIDINPFLNMPAFVIAPLIHSGLAISKLAHTSLQHSVGLVSDEELNERILNVGDQVGYMLLAGMMIMGSRGKKQTGPVERKLLEAHKQGYLEQNAGGAQPILDSGGAFSGPDSPTGFEMRPAESNVYNEALSTSQQIAQAITENNETIKQISDTKSTLMKNPNAPTPDFIVKINKKIRDIKLDTKPIMPETISAINVAAKTIDSMMKNKIEGFDPKKVLDRVDYMLADTIKKVGEMEPTPFTKRAAKILHKAQTISNKGIKAGADAFNSIKLEMERLNTEINNSNIIKLDVLEKEALEANSSNIKAKSVLDESVRQAEAEIMTMRSNDPNYRPQEQPVQPSVAEEMIQMDRENVPVNEAVMSEIKTDEAKTDEPVSIEQMLEEGKITREESLAARETADTALKEIDAEISKYKTEQKTPETEKKITALEADKKGFETVKKKADEVLSIADKVEKKKTVKKAKKAKRESLEGKRVEAPKTETEVVQQTLPSDHIHAQGVYKHKNMLISETEAAVLSMDESAIKENSVVPNLEISDITIENIPHEDVLIPFLETKAAAGNKAAKSYLDAIAENRKDSTKNVEWINKSVEKKFKLAQAKNTYRYNEKIKDNAKLKQVMLDKLKTDEVKQKNPVYADNVKKYIKSLDKIAKREFLEAEKIIKNDAKRNKIMLEESALAKADILEIKEKALEMFKQNYIDMLIKTKQFNQRGKTRYMMDGHVIEKPMNEMRYREEMKFRTEMLVDMLNNAVRKSSRYTTKVVDPETGKWVKAEFEKAGYYFDKKAAAYKKVFTDYADEIGQMYPGELIDKSIENIESSIENGMMQEENFYDYLSSDEKIKDSFSLVMEYSADGMARRKAIRKFDDSMDTNPRSTMPEAWERNKRPPSSASDGKTTEGYIRDYIMNQLDEMFMPVGAKRNISFDETLDFRDPAHAADYYDHIDQMNHITDMAENDMARQQEQGHAQIVDFAKLDAKIEKLAIAMKKNGYIHNSIKVPIDINYLAGIDKKGKLKYEKVRENVSILIDINNSPDTPVAHPSAARNIFEKQILTIDAPAKISDENRGITVKGTKIKLSDNIGKVVSEEVSKDKNISWIELTEDDIRMDAFEKFNNMKKTSKGDIDFVRVNKDITIMKPNKDFKVFKKDHYYIKKEDSLIEMPKMDEPEIKHAKKIKGEQVSEVMEIDTETNISDKNRLKVYDIGDQVVFKKDGKSYIGEVKNISWKKKPQVGNKFVKGEGWHFKPTDIVKKYDISGNKAVVNQYEIVKVVFGSAKELDAGTISKGADTTILNIKQSLDRVGYKFTDELAASLKEKMPKALEIYIAKNLLSGELKVITPHEILRTKKGSPIRIERRSDFREAVEAADKKYDKLKKPEKVYYSGKMTVTKDGKASDIRVQNLMGEIVSSKWEGNVLKGDIRLKNTGRMIYNVDLEANATPRLDPNDKVVYGHYKDTLKVIESRATGQTLVQDAEGRKFVYDTDLLQDASSSDQTVFKTPVEAKYQLRPEINKGENIFEESKITLPKELANNIKNIIDKEGFNIFKPNQKRKMVTDPIEKERILKEIETEVKNAEKRGLFDIYYNKTSLAKWLESDKPWPGVKAFFTTTPKPGIVKNFGDLKFVEYDKEYKRINDPLIKMQGKDKLKKPKPIGKVKKKRLTNEFGVGAAYNPKLASIDGRDFFTVGEIVDSLTTKEITLVQALNALKDANWDAVTRDLKPNPRYDNSTTLGKGLNKVAQFFDDPAQSLFRNEDVIALGDRIEGQIKNTVMNFNNKANILKKKLEGQNLEKFIDEFQQGKYAAMKSKSAKPNNVLDEYAKFIYELEQFKDLLPRESPIEHYFPNIARKEIKRNLMARDLEKTKMEGMTDMEFIDQTLGQPGFLSKRNEKLKSNEIYVTPDVVVKYAHKALNYYYQKMLYNYSLQAKEMAVKNFEVAKTRTIEANNILTKFEKDPRSVKYSDVEEARKTIANPDYNPYAWSEYMKEIDDYNNYLTKAPEYIDKLTNKILDQNAPALQTTLKLAKLFDSLPFKIKNEKIVKDSAGKNMIEADVLKDGKWVRDTFSPSVVLSKNTASDSLLNVRTYQYAAILGLHIPAAISQMLGTFTAVSALPWDIKTAASAFTAVIKGLKRTERSVELGIFDSIESLENLKKYSDPGEYAVFKKVMDAVMVPLRVMDTYSKNVAYNLMVDRLVKEGTPLEKAEVMAANAVKPMNLRFGMMHTERYLQSQAGSFIGMYTPYITKTIKMLVDMAEGYKKNSAVQQYIKELNRNKTPEQAAKALNDAGKVAVMKWALLGVSVYVLGGMFMSDEERAKRSKNPFQSYMPGPYRVTPIWYGGRAAKNVSEGNYKKARNDIIKVAVPAGNVMTQTILK